MNRKPSIRPVTTGDGHVFRTAFEGSGKIPQRDALRKVGFSLRLGNMSEKVVTFKSAGFLMLEMGT